MQLSMEQSNRSIELLSDLMDSVHGGGATVETMYNVVTASILFAHLSCLQGHVSQAIEHARSGLRVLRNFENANPTQTSAQEYPVSLSNLATLLTSFYGQIRCMINDEALVQWDSDPLVSKITLPSSYASITEAHAFVESLWHNLLAFLQHAEMNRHAVSEDLAILSARHQAMWRALQNSRDALDDLAGRDSPNSNDRGEAGLIILRLYHTLIGLRLKINPFDPASRESAFDALQPDLEQMLQYCEILAASPSQPTFSSGLGYVMPLHTIAARCRNPQTRRRALYLLLHSQRREGMWDGSLTGQIATKTMQREEEMSLLDSITKEDKRVREVKLEFVAERMARLRYITVADWKAKLQGEQHLISW
jgi:hypothetical protein